MSFRFAYVYFESANVAEKACKRLNGIKIDGRNIKVEYEKIEYTAIPVEPEGNDPCFRWISPNMLVKHLLPPQKMSSLFLPSVPSNG